MNQALHELIEKALSEDIGPGDVTSEATIPAESASTAVILAKQHLVLAGMEVAREVFRTLDPDITFTPFAKDGDVVHGGTELAHVSGNTRSLLAGERVALNLLQH